MKSVKYNIQTKIVDDFPEIILEINYRDEFSDDYYVLKSGVNHSQGSKEIPFTITKNNKEYGTVKMSHRNIKSLMNEFIEQTDDYDFKEEFEKSDVTNIISEQVNEFLNRYDEIVVSVAITTEGEVKRMKQLAGLENIKII